MKNRILFWVGAVYSLFIATLPLPGQTFTFSVLAGTPGLTGTNDGVNQDARFSFPAGIAADTNGDLYVADLLNHAIRKLSRSGTNWNTVTLAGLPGTSGYADGTNTDARFNRPSGIAVDNQGSLFVAERYNHTIRRITPVGTNWVVTTIAGLALATGQDDGTNSDARFYLPSGVTVDASNHVFVADSANFTIRELAPSGTNWVVTTIAGSPLNYDHLDGTNSDAAFNYPYGLTASRDGRIYVADWGNNSIREMSRIGSDWVVTTVAGFSTNTGSADGLGSAASFNNPTAVAVGATGSLFVADQRNHTIRKIVPGQNGWTVSTVGGQAGKKGTTNGSGTNALFNLPWGIVTDPTGTLFIGEYGSSIIRTGVPSDAALPSLQISLAGNQIVLSWPSSATGFVLDKAAGFGPDANWVALTNGMATVGNLTIVTNTIDSPTAFYRLRK